MFVALAAPFLVFTLEPFEAVRTCQVPTHRGTPAPVSSLSS